jgi:hypothetical protein
VQEAQAHVQCIDFQVRGGMAFGEEGSLITLLSDGVGGHTTGYQVYVTALNTGTHQSEHTYGIFKFHQSN